MIDLAQIPELCRSKNFDLLKINHQIDIAAIQTLLQSVMHDYTMMNKDGYQTYEAIGMQYADADNPLYDAVQQTKSLADCTAREALAWCDRQDHDVTFIRALCSGVPLDDTLGRWYAFIDQATARKCRPPARFTEPNEIGQQFDFVYDMFAEHGIKLERGRVLKASAGHVHAEHLDYDIRIHLPVFTNPDCQMVYAGQHYHMPADGYLYLINGFRLHHFFNHGSQDRVHLVWLIQSELYK